MRKFLGSLFRNESDDPPPEVQSASNGPQPPRKVYGDDPTPDSEIVLKIVLIGGASTGKTSIVRRYLQGCFTHQYIPTIGIDMSTAKLQSKSNPDAEYRIQFCDVAHAEVRGKHHKSIFRGAVGIVMVFDCCNVQSVSAVDEWRLAYEDCMRNTNVARTPMILLANKSDVGPPVIKPADLDTYCERGGYAIWRLTSSRSGNTVIEALDRLLDISIEFRDLQQASRTRRKPEKLISSKSQMLSPPIRGPSIGNVPSTLGTSVVPPPSSFASNLSTSSSGSSVNDNSYISSSAYSSFRRGSMNTSTTVTSTSSTNSTSTTPRINSDLSKIPVSRPPALTVQIETNVNSNETPSSTKHTETNNIINNSNNNNSNNTSINTTPTLNNISHTNGTSPNDRYANMEGGDIVSLDLDPPTPCDTMSDADTNPSSTASGTTSASASTHASQRRFSSIQNSGEFVFLSGEARPSILSITNALAIDDIKLGELVDIAEDFYSKLKADLDQLFMNVKPSRKSDLQILEFQRFDEYVKLMDVLCAHKEKALALSESSGEVQGSDASVKKYPTEHLQVLLSENMKKWNQLIMNLHTEVSLHRSGIFDDSRSSNNTRVPPGGSLKSSSSDTMLYSRYENAQTLSAGGTATTTNGNSPTRSKENSALMTPTMGVDQGENSSKRQQQQGNTRRMGFGFKNVGKNPAAILQLVNPTPTSFSLDNDNISSPPSPYNSVHSPTPSSPSTSPTSPPAPFRSRASSSGDQPLSVSSSSSSSTQDPSLLSTKPHKSQSSSHSHSRPHTHHTRSVSLSTAPSFPPPTLASHIIPPPATSPATLAATSSDTSSSTPSPPPTATHSDTSPTTNLQHPSPSPAIPLSPPPDDSPPPTSPTLSIPPSTLSPPTPSVLSPPTPSILLTSPPASPSPSPVPPSPSPIPPIPPSIDGHHVDAAAATG